MMAKQPEKLRVWFVILVAACFFFLAMSSIAVGVVEVLQHNTGGFWLVSVGVILHIVAVLIVLGGERKPNRHLVNS